jgi:hypothetical protein
MKRSSILQSLLLGVLTCVGPLAVPQPAFAQYLGNNFHGDFGVNSGTQSGPGFYVAIPFAQWNADHIKDADGNTIAASQFQGFDVRAMFPTIIGVTPKKVLGANYGFMVALPFSTVRPERTIPESFEPDWGLRHVCRTLSRWHAPRRTSSRHGFYAPTARAGANDNVGLGMWSQTRPAPPFPRRGEEISATTAY